MSSARQHVLFSKISKMKNYGDVLVSLILLSAKKNYDSAKKQAREMQRNLR